MFFSDAPEAFLDLFLGGTVADLDQLIECLPVEQGNVTNGEVKVEVRLFLRLILMPQAIYHGCSIKNVKDIGNVVLRHEGVDLVPEKFPPRDGLWAIDSGTQIYALTYINSENFSLTQRPHDIYGQIIDQTPIHEDLPIREGGRSDTRNCQTRPHAFP